MRPCHAQRSAHPLLSLSPIGLILQSLNLFSINHLMPLKWLLHWMNHHRHHHHLHHRRMGRQRLAHQHQPHQHHNNNQHHHNQHLHHHPHHHPTHPRHLRARNNDAPRVPHHDRESRPPVGREQVAARGIRSAARFRGRPVRSCPCPSCPFPFRCSALGTIPDFPALGTIPDFPALGAVPHWRARRRPDPNAARAGLLGAWNRRPRWPGRPLRPRAHGNVLEPVATGSGRSSC